MLCIAYSRFESEKNMETYKEEAMFQKKMLMFVLVLLVGIISLSASALELNVSPSKPIKSRVDKEGHLRYSGELLAVFKVGTTVEEINAMIEKYSQYDLKVHPNYGLLKNRFDQNKFWGNLLFNEELIDLYELIDLLNEENIVEGAGHVTPGFVGPTNSIDQNDKNRSLIPPDQLFDEQWNLKKVQAPKAWHMINGYAPKNSRDVLVVVLDRGHVYTSDLYDTRWINHGEKEIN